MINDESKVILAKDKKGLMNAKVLSDAIYQHAEEHRNPYADWYIEEHGNEPCMSLYNKSNSKLVRDDLVACFTLFDIFFAYVYYTKTHGRTPSLQDKVKGIPWRQVEVSTVLEEFNEELKSNKKIDKDSVLVFIFSNKLDKTFKEIMERCDAEEVSHMIPKWMDMYEMTLMRWSINKMEKDKDFEGRAITRDLVSFCRDAFSKWLSTKLNDVKYQNP